MPQQLDDLVFDRTKADIDRVKTLTQKMIDSAATAEERSEWFGGSMKGAWNASDLNRIEDWTAFLADKLRGYGYWVNITPRKAERPQGSRLPDGYTELEYIQSSGTQYVDTLFKPNNNTRVVLDGQFTSSAVSQFLFGCRTGTNTVNYCILTRTAGFRSDYGESKVENTSVANTERFIFDKNKNICTIGSAEITNAVSTFQSAYSLALFASNDGGSAKYYGSMKLYSCKIYDNGTLVRDYVPCKNAVGSVGLYDLVQSKFYANAGTGAFIAGAEIPQAEEPEEPLDPALWYQSDIPTRGEIDRIRRNVDALQTGFARLPDWREILYNNTVDFGQANALEWDLQRIYDWMNAMAAAFLTRQANTIFMQAGGILNA